MKPISPHWPFKGWEHTHAGWKQEKGLSWGRTEEAKLHLRQKDNDKTQDQPPDVMRSPTVLLVWVLLFPTTIHLKNHL